MDKQNPVIQINIEETTIDKSMDPNSTLISIFDNNKFLMHVSSKIY